MRATAFARVLFCAVLVSLAALTALIAGCGPDVRGSLALSRGDYTQALALYGEALAKEPESLPLRQRVGVTYFEMKAYPQAEAVFTDILQCAPGEPNALFYLGLSHLGKGDREAGLDLLEQYRWPGKFYHQTYVREEAKRLRKHPEAPPLEAIRSLQEALEQGIKEQRKWEIETGFIRN